ncbi:PKD domain protein [Thermoplasmatales archaeon SCGC AB-539-N05]|nr:PKD domain protein [Thermoplasmatales archaeon SCGC AB-539-N05]
MKREIMLCMIICTLLIYSFSVIAEKVDFGQMPKGLNTIDDEADVPTWAEGDTWTYNIGLTGLYSMISFNWAINDLVFSVDDVTSSAYKVGFEGTVTGSLSIEDASISGTLRDTTLEGEIQVEKSNLGYKQLEIHIDGKVVIALIPINLEADVSVMFDPTFVTLDFPLSVGKQWNIPISDVIIQGSFSLVQTIEIPLDSSDWVGGGNAECTSKETETVTAGTYDAFKILSDQDIYERYYAPAAGTIIKAFGESFSLDEIIIELKSTTYQVEEPGAPNKPNRPSGPSSGVPDKEYTYSASTTDPEGDQINYLFNWGDGSDSGWLGLYNSGETVSASHKWTSKGSYEIKVKAKDVNGMESEWSDPLGVSMPKNKNTMFASQQLINIIQKLFPSVNLHKLGLMN